MIINVVSNSNGVFITVDGRSIGALTLAPTVGEYRVVVDLFGPVVEIASVDDPKSIISRPSKAFGKCSQKEHVAPFLTFPSRTGGSSWISLRRRVSGIPEERSTNSVDEVYEALEPELQ